MRTKNMKGSENEEGYLCCCPRCEFERYFYLVNIRNNRLKRLIIIGAPKVIIDAEKHMLREAVDALLTYLDKTEVIMKWKKLLTLTESTTRQSSGNNKKFEN